GRGAGGRCRPGSPTREPVGSPHKLSPWYAAPMTQRDPPDNDERPTDLGHRGDFDRPQIEALLRLTPTERLRKHEGWRLFVKKALADAELRRARRLEAGTTLPMPSRRSEGEGER